MEELEKQCNKGKMTGKEVVKRIDFLLNGLRILNNVKKDSILENKEKNKFIIDKDDIEKNTK
jgi:hypothetical protein